MSVVVPLPRAAHAVWLASLVVHVGGAMTLSRMEVHRPPPPTVVEMRTIERPQPVAPAPEPPPAPEPAPAPAPAPPPRPAPAAAPPPVAAPSFGVNLSNLGSGGSGGGIAVQQGDPGGRVREEARVLEAPTPVPGACAEPVVKPRASRPPRPTYTEAARAAEIEGKVRLSITLDPSGAVAKVELLEGLGHGLDEAAILAVQEAAFEPASRCGVPESSTFTLAVRFTL